MGCGCGKAKKNRLARLKELEKKNRTQRLNAKKSKMTSPDKLAQAERNRKLAICNKCSNSAQNKKERKAGIKVCHALGRYTFAIASNPGVKCPVNKF